jgi:hypothetical protein
MCPFGTLAFARKEASRLRLTTRSERTRFASETRSCRDASFAKAKQASDEVVSAQSLVVHTGRLRRSGMRARPRWERACRCSSPRHCQGRPCRPALSQLPRNDARRRPAAANTVRPVSSSWTIKSNRTPTSAVVAAATSRSWIWMPVVSPTFAAKLVYAKCAPSSESAGASSSHMLAGRSRASSPSSVRAPVTRSRRK